MAAAGTLLGTGALGMTELSQMVELHLSCVDLPKMDTLSHTDAYIKVSELASDGITWQDLGTTEVIWDTEAPKFSRSIELAFHFEERQRLRFVVMDKDDLEADDLIGECIVDVGQIMGSRGGVFKASILKTRKYGNKPRGQIRISGEPVSNSNDVLNIQFSGVKLRNMDGLFGRSDPFITIERLDVGLRGGNEASDGRTEAHLARPKTFSKARRRSQAAAKKQQKILTRHGADGTPAAFDASNAWTQVWKGPIIRNNLNPNWPRAKIPMRILCGSDDDYARPLRITCFDWDADGSHDFIGAFTSSVNDLLAVSPRIGWDLQRQRSWPKKGYKSGGRITCARPPVVEHVPGLLDYVLGGCEISLSIAVDFTGSNGPTRDPRSLHHVDPTGRAHMNAYERALSAVGGILAPCVLQFAL